MAIRFTPITQDIDKETEEQQKPKGVRFVPLERPMSRKEMSALGVPEKTNAMQRQVIRDNLIRQFGAIGAGSGGFTPTPEQTKDVIKAAPEITKAAVAGTERMLGTVGTALEFKGDEMRDPIRRTLAKAAPGTAIAQFISDKFGLPEKLQKSGRYIREYWDEQASKGWEAPDPELMEAKWNRPIQYGARVTFESAPTFAAAIGAGYATGNPTVGLAMMGAFEKLNSYAAQRKKGASFHKADMISTLSGAWEAVTEKIPFDFILKGKARTKLLKALTGAGLEGIQEVLAGMGQNFLEHFGYNAKDWKTIPGAVKEGLKHTFDNWIESLVAGITLGGIAGGAIEGFSSRDLERVGKTLGVPVTGLTREAAAEKINQVLEARRGLQRGVDEVAEQEPAAAQEGEKPITKYEREALRTTLGMSIQEIANTPAAELREKLTNTNKIRRRAGGFLSIPVDTPAPAKARFGLESLYQDYVNRFASIENLDKKAQKLGMIVPPGQKAGTMARLYLGLGRVVESVLEKNTFRNLPDGTQVITGEGLKPILDDYDANVKPFEQERSKRRKDFNTYMQARRIVEDLQRPADERGKSIATKKQVTQARKDLAALKKKYGREGTAEIERNAQRLYGFQRRVLQMLVDGGNLSQKGYNKIVKDNPHYVSFERIFEKTGLFAGLPRAIFTKAKAPLKKIRGTELELEKQDPIEMAIKNTYRIMEAAARNTVARNVAQYMPLFPNDINQVNIKMYPIRVDPKEILTEVKTFRSEASKVVSEAKKIRKEGGEGADISGPVAKMETVVKEALTHRGFSEGEANSFIAQIKKGKPAEGEGPTNTIEEIDRVIKETVNVMTTETPVETTIFRPSQFMPRGQVIEYFENGKRRYMEVSDNLYKAMTGLNEEGSSIITQVLARPAAWLRVGATITPEFMTRNPLRDTWTAFMQTAFGFIPFVDPARAIADVVGRTDIYYDWLRSGGAYSGFVELSRPALKKAYKELTSTRGQKLLKKLNVITTAEDLSQLMEQATRLAVYKKAVRKGLTPVEAGFASREATVDFARRGAKMGGVAKTVAFLNAGIQGFDKTVRHTLKHPIATGLKGGLAITLPSVLLAALNHDNPEYKEIPQWQKDLFWLIHVGDTWYRVPKPFVYGQMFGTIPERFMEYWLTKDPESFDGMVTSVIKSSSPIGLNPVEALIPTAAKPIIENMTNHSFFRERSIVPKSVEKLAKSEQYSRYTTESAKYLGKWLNYSPAKIENLFYGYTGGTGRYVLGGTDYLIRSIKGEERGGRPKELSDVPLVKGFVTRPAIGPSAESISDFYNLSEPIIANRRSFTDAVTRGNEKRAAEILKKHPEIEAAPNLIKIQTAMSQINRIIDMVVDSDMPEEEKRAIIRERDQQRVDLARQANEFMKGIKQN